MEKFRIVYLKDVVKADIPRLGNSARLLIKRSIEERLTTDPLKHGEPLARDLKGFRRLRVSKYRIIYKIQDQVVVIFAIGIRDKIYSRKIDFSSLGISEV